MMRTVITALAIALAPLVPAPADLPATPATQLPTCAYEDGNTNGLPCTWTDPDTGRAFYVDSANYR